MKLSVKVKDTESAVVEMTIEMTMKEWRKLSEDLDFFGSQGKLRDRITFIHQSMQRVVEGEVPLIEDND